MARLYSNTLSYSVMVEYIAHSITNVSADGLRIKECTHKPEGHLCPYRIPLCLCYICFERSGRGIIYIFKFKCMLK